MGRRRRRRLAGTGLVLIAALTVSACSNTANTADDTVTQVVTVGSSSSSSTAGGSGSGVSRSGTAGSSAPAGTSSAPAGSSTKPSPTTRSSTGTTASSAPPSVGSFDNPQDGVALPDGFVPKKLKKGEHPPQFIVVSFDGVGWNEKWQYWFNISKQVPFRFTGFLSGTYMLSDQTKDAYHPPFYDPGTSEINWNTAADLPVEISDINQALAEGNEIGTHFNGHFCQGAGLPSGGNNWSTADWNTELDQFFSLVKNYRTNNPGLDPAAVLNLKGPEVRGERTPCLEGTQDDLFPALQAHGIVYDSSFTKRGISWPKQSPKYKVWQIGMAEFPMHGTLPDASPVDAGARNQHVQITMDYNFWYSQRNASNDVSPEQSKLDSQQVQETYTDMYNAAFNGNRAPLILGNHFNQWNNNAYSDAIANFVLATCAKRDTQCVPFQDLLAWMQVQDPQRLAQLQAQEPEMGTTTGG